MSPEDDEIEDRDDPYANWGEADYGEDEEALESLDDRPWEPVEPAQYWSDARVFLGEHVVEIVSDVIQRASLRVPSGLDDEEKQRKKAVDDCADLYAMAACTSDTAAIAKAAADAKRLAARADSALATKIANGLDKRLRLRPDYVAAADEVKAAEDAAIVIPYAVDASMFTGKEPPERRWIVKGMIPRDGVTILSGDGGAGKTMLALQLGHAAATNGKWLGQDIEARRVIVVTAEDDEAELHRRLHSIARHEGVWLNEKGRLTLVSLAGKETVLGAPDGKDQQVRPTKLYEGLRRLLIRGERPDLLILDPIADLFGGDENNRSGVRQFMTLLRALSLEFGCAVLALSHPSLTGMASGTGTSGSTAWSNSARSRLYLTSPPRGDDEAQDSDARILTVRKANYGPTGDLIALRWSDGVFVVDSPDSPARAAKSTKADVVFMQLLARFNEQGRNVSATPSNTFAPSLFEQEPDSEGIRKKVFTEAMNRLLKEGRIRIETTGPKSKERKILVLVGKRED